jgi:cystathionine beta-lyase/cystathionine gamma-synthase
MSKWILRRVAVTDGYVRLSVGIEDTDNILADLDRELALE